MLAPQSDEELRPYLEALQREDARLSFRWSPQHVCTTKGTYSALGVATPGTYEGRWTVIMYDVPGVNAHRDEHGREYTVLCVVAGFERQDGVLYGLVDGPYTPIDDRIVELIRSGGFASVREKVQRQNEASMAARDGIGDDSSLRAAIDKVHFDGNYRGGVGNWQGKGADFEAMARARQVLLPAAT